MSVRRGVPRRSSYGEIIVHTTFSNTRVAQNPAIVSLYASDPAYDVRPTDLSATEIQMRHHNNAWFDNKSYYAIWSTVESIGQKIDIFFADPSFDQGLIASFVALVSGSGLQRFHHERRAHKTDEGLDAQLIIS